MLLALSYYASHSNKLKQMVGVNKLKQMVGVAINTYLVAQRELEYHLVTLLCSRWASRAERLCSVAVCLVGGVWVGLSDNRNKYIFL